MTARSEVLDHYSLSGWLDLESQTGERFEFLDGKLVPMAGGSIAHSRISRNVLAALDEISLETGSFEVFGSDQRIYLPRYNYYVYPDAVVITERPQISDADAQAIINPVLIIEVASPSTSKNDRGNKFTEYKNLPSFKEYALIRQDRTEVSLFFREAPDLWRNTDITELSQEVIFRSIACAIAMERIYRKVDLV